MRYLIYTETFPSRLQNDIRQTGIGRYCADLASGLAALGHDVTAATNSGIGDATAPEPYRVEVLGAVPRTRVERIQRATQLRRVARAGQADMVLVGDLLGHRVVATLAGAVGAPYCPVFYGTELSAWKAGRARLAGSVRQAWIPWYLRRSRSVICISRFTQALLHQLTPRPGRECIVYPCASEMCLNLPVRPGVTAALRRQFGQRDPAAMIVLTLARISERKNQLGVLRAMAELHARTNVRIHYVVVGNVDSEAHRPYLHQLRAFAEAHGLAKALTIVENTTDEEKVAYLDGCDAFVMLSQRVGSSVEGFGISVVEASARGKPVIVSDEGGMPETVLEGVTGFTVPPRDASRVAEALGILARDPARRTAMGSAGREFTLRNFTPEVSARQLHSHLWGQTDAPATAGADDWGAMKTPRVEDL